MLLFIHGEGATPSFWLPQIRGLIGQTTEKFSDRYLLDLFTISLPGHIDNDNEFDLNSIQTQILNHIQEKTEMQNELASMLVLSGNKEFVRVLRDTKISLIGQGVGSVIALYFTFKNLQLVRGILLSRISFEYNNFFKKLRSFFYIKILFSLNLRFIRNLLKIVRNVRFKSILTIYAENLQRKGFLSSLKIMDDYSFYKLYEVLSLEQKIKFNQIKVMIINGRLDFLSTPKNVKKLKSYLSSQYEKMLVVATNPENFSTSSFDYKIYSFTSSNPMDSKPIDFLLDMRTFLSN